MIKVDRSEILEHAAKLAERQRDFGTAAVLRAMALEKFYRCNICGFLIDASCPAEKPAIDSTMAGRAKTK